MTLHTRNCAESVGDGAVFGAHRGSQMELIWGNSWCRSEAEVLEEGDQAYEEFHSVRVSLGHTLLPVREEGFT